MPIRSKAVLLCCGLTIAALYIALIPQVISQESQQRATPLKDVCPQGWSHYKCGNSVRLCVPPDLESQYDLANSVKEWSEQNCGEADKTILPDAWAHATPEEVGYLLFASRWQAYDFYCGVVKLDSSMIDSSVFTKKRYNNEEMNRRQNMVDAFSRLRSKISSACDDYRWQEGRAAYKAHVDMSAEQYKIKLPPPEIGVKDVCHAGWSRFSCQFVRLCVSPDVVAKYDLNTSREFGYAHCKADSRVVPEEETHYSPEDVGFFAGSLLAGPRYIGAVKLDSSDIFNGNIEEAIQRLALVPIPTSGLMDYDRGFEKGQAMFVDYLAKNAQKDRK
jgi:hypothetical protein